MDYTDYRTNMTARYRRRPYSCNSSIKSVIHGPNLHELEEELQKMRIDDKLSLLHRSSPFAMNKVSPLSNRVAHKNELNDTTNNAKKRLTRPKTCIASFPSSQKNSSIIRNSNKLQRSTSNLETLLLDHKKNNMTIRNGFAPIREIGENESIAQRHKWAIRSDAVSCDTDPTASNLMKRRKRIRQSASAPPSGRTNFQTNIITVGKFFPKKRCQSAKEVEAFTPASRMKNTVVIGPKTLNVYKPRPSPPTIFKMMYERGDVPCTLHQDYKGQSIRWKVDIEKLDYHQYLPLFFDGLRETRHPYDFFSRAGVRELLSKGGEKIVPVIPQLILPIKKALDTRIPGVICTVLKVMQELVHSTPAAGEALVPYYRQLLPTLNLFQHRNVNCGDEIDYSQQRRENIGDLIQETLELFEKNGGKDAYVNIKYMVPTYQSCVNN